MAPNVFPNNNYNDVDDDDDVDGGVAAHSNTHIISIQYDEATKKKERKNGIAEEEYYIHRQGNSS